MRVVPFAAFFLSGASSLIFQAIWTRLLHHVFGATSVAMSSVLTAFMAGLGLGARVFGARASRFERPLRAYALCELGVAVCALVIPTLVRSDGVLASLNAALRQGLGEASFTFMLARFLCVLPVLLVPTTLMGGTLPLLAQHFVHGQASSTRASTGAGSLYAINTFGAVSGTALSSFVLMPRLGVAHTNLVAVAINALLGLALLALAARTSTSTNMRELSAASTPRASEDEGAHTLPSPAQRAISSLPRWARRLALLGFAVSGACAMTYEVVWSRALSMAIGSSLQAFALILVTFLVGIAGGSALVSRALSRPDDARPALSVAAAVACALVLLAIAPAAVLSSLGLALAAGALAAAVILGAVALARNKAQEQQALDADLAEPTRDTSHSVIRFVLLVPFAIAAFEAVRFATMRGSIAGVTRHGYLPFITLAVVSVIALFTWLVLELRRSPWLLAGAVQLTVALGTLTGYVFQDEIPYGFARLVSSIDDLASHVGLVRFFMFLTAGLCTLPATLGMGAMFPLTLSLWSRNDDEVGADVGTVYSANTLGSILGSWLPGFVLLPRIGMEATLKASMLLNALLAMAMIGADFVLSRTRRHEDDPQRAPRATRALFGVALSCTLALLWIMLASPRALTWSLSHMTLGAFRVSLAREVLDVSSWGEPDLVYYRDGVSTTVSVERWGRHLSLKNNGKVDASNGDDMPTQIMVSAYPLLLHPRGAKDLDVAIVGFGSGVTVGAALQFPVRHIDAMELERAVVEAAVDYFADVSHLGRTLADFPYVREPRLTLHADDGRNFLASTSAQYDVIISEPSNPWITGVSDLFTVDHFRVSKRKLKPGGVYCQWVQLYEMSPENIKTIYRTFASQFRYVLAFAAEELSSDTILVGSDSPLPLDLTHVRRAMDDPRVSAELERAYVHSPYDVWSRILFASRDEMLRFTQHERREDHGVLRDVQRATGNDACAAPSCVREPVPLNTDDNMLIELRAPSDLIGYARYAGYLDIFYSEGWPYGALAAHLAGLESPRARAEMALALLAHGRKAHARALLGAPTLSADADTRLAERTAALLLGVIPEPAVELEPPAPGPALSPPARRAFEAAHGAILTAMSRGDYPRALHEMERVPAALRHASGPGFRFLYGMLLWRAAQGDRNLERSAVAELEDLIRKDEVYTRAHPELYYFLARALDDASSFDKAVRNMRAYAALAP